jgi:hypothetical protein
LTAQVSSYAIELWEYYGLTPITIWDVESEHFFSMTSAIDKERARQKAEARKK